MEGNRWYKCFCDFDMIDGYTAFSEGNYYFFETDGLCISTKNDLGDSHSFDNADIEDFKSSFRLATEDEIKGYLHVDLKKEAKHNTQLTRREMFAMAAMQGISGSTVIGGVSNIDSHYEHLIAAHCVRLADALIKALETPTEKP